MMKDARLSSALQFAREKSFLGFFFFTRQLFLVKLRASKLRKGGTYARMNVLHENDSDTTDNFNGNGTDMTIPFFFRFALRTKMFMPRSFFLATFKFYMLNRVESGCGHVIGTQFRRIFS